MVLSGRPFANAVRDGHITHAEAEERYGLHRLVVGEPALGEVDEDFVEHDPEDVLW
jgi:hypothetical protein